MTVDSCRFTNYVWKLKNCYQQLVIQKYLFIIDQCFLVFFFCLMFAEYFLLTSYICLLVPNRYKVIIDCQFSSKCYWILATPWVLKWATTSEQFLFFMFNIASTIFLLIYFLLFFFSHFFRQIFLDWHFKKKPCWNFFSWLDLFCFSTFCRTIFL